MTVIIIDTEKKRGNGAAATSGVKFVSRNKSIIVITKFMSAKMSAARF